MALDARVRRHTTALAAAGHEVTAVGLLSDDSAAPPEMPLVPGITYAWGDRRPRVPFQGTWGWLTSGLSQRVSWGLWRRGLRHDRIAFRLVAPSFAVLLREAAKYEADIYYANDLNTLPIALALCRRRNTRLIYDAHEIYQEETNTIPPALKEAIRHVERAGAARAGAWITVSNAIATYLASSYDLPPPAVVRNLPEAVADLEPSAVPDSGPLRVLYHSANLALQGRQLQDLVDAVSGLNGQVTLTLRGNLTSRRAEELRAYLSEKLAPAQWTLMPPTNYQDLIREGSRHDIGVVLNSDRNLNERLTLPNKIFEYMMSGLAVLAYRTPSVAEVIESGPFGVVTPTNTVDGLRNGLRTLTENRSELSRTKQRCRRAALETYNWSRERTKLVELVTRLTTGLDAPRPSPR